MVQEVLLGDEALALGAIHAGLTAAYAYPGTPSTEVMEYLLSYGDNGTPRPHAAWCANEKTAYESALGVSFAGRRSLVVMKHVGLNVAADPFMNSALVSIRGGLVVIVADDPGMHSSQNEQDSRYYADFARIICFEPASQQEAYDMAREAFDVSERFEIPVMLRIVTRLAHSRSVVETRAPRPQNVLSRNPDPSSWTLLPGNARRQWRSLLERQNEFVNYSEASHFNKLVSGVARKGVITTGIARNYYFENIDDLDELPSHLHIGAYPVPVELLRKFVANLDHILVLEDGSPFVERMLRGLVETRYTVAGRISGELPPDGELTPDTVRKALFLPERQGLRLEGLVIPVRPPQLCSGCPHGDSFRALEFASSDFDSVTVTGDIGCYTLGAMSPYSSIDSCVCMGASIGMAKGASDAGMRPAVAVIGDSTFLHSGVTALMDAVACNTDMTLLILDNETVGMTGGQTTILSSSRLKDIVLGLGTNPEHVHVLNAHPKFQDANAAIVNKEMKHPGLSVIITVRECLETARRRKKAIAVNHAAEN